MKADDSSTSHSDPQELATVEQLLAHLETLEQQLQQVRDGLTHSHRLATLGTIASIIAHEYNNILTPIISYSQMALAQAEDQDLMRKAVEKSLAGALRAAHISSSLLGFAREADQRHVAALPKVVEEAIACLARDPKRDGIELLLDLPEVKAAISPLHLVQVLVNLLLNAKQAMRRNGGSIFIRGYLQGSLVHLTVSDTGPGIPQEIADRLFEPFVTHRPKDSATGETKGTGLGLSICRDLIRQAGGTIGFESVPGKGTTFHITLPKAEEIFIDP